MCLEKAGRGVCSPSSVCSTWWVTRAKLHLNGLYQRRGQIVVDHLWKTSDAANYANVEPETVMGWIRSGKCTCFKRTGPKAPYRTNPNSFKNWLDLRGKGGDANEVSDKTVVGPLADGRNNLMRGPLPRTI